MNFSLPPNELNPNSSTPKYIPRISLVTGVVNRGDAISETLIADVEALDQTAKQERRNFDVKIYCGASNLTDSRLQIIRDWRELLREPHFRTSDLYLYHFGIFHQLHNSIIFARRDAKVVFYFHNVTPPQHCPVEASRLLHASYRQIELFRSVDILLTASKFSAAQLAGYHLFKPAEVVPLFGANAITAPPGQRQPWQAGGPLRLLYCGRFARSKGIITFLEALRLLPPEEHCPIEVTLAGITEHSDPIYLDKLETYIKRMPAQVQVTFARNASASALKELFCRNDALVLPSLHEGFGMPVVEAFAAGTPVICSDIPSLIELSDGLGLTFAAGVTSSLVVQLERFREAHRRGAVLCDEGEMARDVWERRIASHSASYRRQAYIERMSQRISAWLEPTRVSAKTYRDQVSLLAADAFGQPEDRVDPLSAALAAGLIALETAETTGRDEDLGLRILLRWLFPHKQSEHDLKYWRSELAKLGWQQFLIRLSNTPEVQQSPARRQLSVFVKGILHSRPPVPPEASASVTPDVRSHTLALQLLLASNIPSPDFIQEAYRLVLLREADDEGFQSYFRALEAGQMSRAQLIAYLTMSQEYIKLRDNNRSQVYLPHDGAMRNGYSDLGLEHADDELQLSPLISAILDGKIDGVPAND